MIDVNWMALDTPLLFGVLAAELLHLAKKDFLLRLDWHMTLILPLCGWFLITSNPQGVTWQVIFSIGAYFAGVIIIETSLGLLQIYEKLAEQEVKNEQR